MSRGGDSVRVQTLKNKAVLSDKCHVAECFVDRLRGLIGKKGLEPGEAMFFPRNNSIHMWFMRFPIDVIFVTQVKREEEGMKVYRVSSAHEKVRAWRPHPLIDWRASETLELPEGTIRKHAIQPGDELCIG